MDILTLFLDNPEQDYHVREAARITKNSPTTISSKLKQYQKEGLLLSKRERNHLLYRANQNNPNYRDLKLYHNLKLIRTSGMIAYLQEFFNQPSAIVLFGSFRKAENIPSSDIDLLVISAKKEELDLTEFEAKLKHKVQLFIYSKKEFKELQKKNPELLNSFINGFILEGYLEVF